MLILIVLLVVLAVAIMWYVGVFDKKEEIVLPNFNGDTNYNPCRTFVFKLISTHSSSVVYENCQGNIVKVVVESETQVCGKSIITTGANIEVTELPFCNQ